MHSFMSSDATFSNSKFFLTFRSCFDVGWPHTSNVPLPASHLKLELSREAARTGKRSRITLKIAIKGTLNKGSCWI